VSGLATRERVAAPAADRPLAVPGVGLCVPEPLAGGWLLRASTRLSALRLELELGVQPQAVVHGASTWRHPLTTRHAELLLLLAKAGAAEMDAAALSCAVYGDSEHVVAVRAELSRLRRTLGGLLCSQPYRIDPERHRHHPGAPGQCAAADLHRPRCAGPARPDAGSLSDGGMPRTD